MERKRASGTLANTELDRLSIKQFRSDISKFIFSKDQFTKEAEKWQELMNNKYGDLMSLLRTEIQSLKEELAIQGYTEKDYWKLLQGHSLAGYMVRAMIAIADEMENKKEKELVDSLSDKSQAYQKITEHRHRLGMDTPHMHDFINKLFTQKPVLSDNDPGMALIRQQIDYIPQ